MHLAAFWLPFGTRFIAFCLVLIDLGTFWAPFRTRRVATTHKNYVLWYPSKYLFQLVKGSQNITLRRHCARRRRVFWHRSHLPHVSIKMWGRSAGPNVCTLAFFVISRVCSDIHHVCYGSLCCLCVSVAVLLGCRTNAFLAGRRRDRGFKTSQPRHSRLPSGMMRENR